MGNKKGKTELIFKKKIIIIIISVERAGRHFGFFKRAGRHEKGTGRRALQKKPRQNTDFDGVFCHISQCLFVSDNANISPVTLTM